MCIVEESREEEGRESTDTKQKKFSPACLLQNSALPILPIPTHPVGAYTETTEQPRSTILLLPFPPFLRRDIFVLLLRRGSVRLVSCMKHSVAFVSGKFSEPARGCFSDR